MDENQFKQTYREINDLPCAFEKAILSTRCACPLSRRILIAEREAVACQSAAARDDCRALLEWLRGKARFSLKLTQVSNTLPHGKEIKVQIGGLHGLQAAVSVAGSSGETITDVNGLVQTAKARFGAWTKMPYTEIVKYIVNYQHRRRR